jgi:glucokinase
MIDTAVVLGIDIGGTTTSFGFVDRAGNLLSAASIPTEGQDPAEALVARLHRRIEEARDGLPPLAGIGIGAPNANHHKGTIEQVVNLNWGPFVDFTGLVRKRWDVPVAITNDANAAAIGEMLFGNARGMNDFIVITLGTGLGSGLVVDGRLVYGSSGFAGELGHITVDPEGRQCACGKRGCLETYVSATGLRRTALVMLAERNEASPLRGLSFPEMTSKRIFEAAREGDAIALAVFDRTARILGMKLADAVAHTSPEAIFLAGGLAAAGDILFEPTRRYLDEFLCGLYRGTVKLLPSKLKAGDSAILGAAALIWNELGGRP